MKEFWGRLGYYPVGIVDAVGHKRGIWFLSANLKFSCKILWAMNQCVTLEIDGGGRRWICSAIYGSPQATNRVELWSHLLDIGLCIQDPWVVFGDFNDILSVHEVKGDSCGLFDLTTSGRRFTWFRKIQGNKEIAKRLDRACCTTEWRLLFPEAFVEVLSRSHSDHCPLLIRCQGVPIKKGNRPFRFQAAWATHPDYKAIVQKSWDSTDFGIHRKLLGVQEASLEFNSTVFGNIFIKKRELEGYLNRIQRKMEADNDPILKHKEEELRAEYNIVLAQEELLWYQKSRDQWVRYGDRNTSFFHMQTILRRKSNKVHGLLVSDGSWSDDPEVLQREVVHFFKNIFCSTKPVEVNCMGEIPMPSLSQDACDNLSKPVTMLEVKEALDNMSSFKAPGPDGFQIFFFKEYWDVVGHEASNLSILWNGNRLDSFQPRRGLRQGDPISPYLFVLCMERLACFISKQVDEGIWDGVAVSRGGPRVSHLMFADDLLLFCKAKKSQVQNVVHTLELFCKASGRMSQSFWYHAWRPCGTLAPLVPFVHISDSHLKLEDVWHLGHWRWDILCTMIPEEVKLDLMLFDPIKQAGDKTAAFGGFGGIGTMTSSTKMIHGVRRKLFT
ncbi:uncharacterized protein [Arachis hypogaea]|uniref:uncharacterized protein n=1 Tax=Arachis hypogaea TaxID=3818 RepID=UPI003B220862